MQLKTAIFLCVLPLGAVAQQPLSAIDWLNDIAPTPIIVAQPKPKPQVNEPAVAKEVVLPTVAVTPLDDPSPDAAGLLPFNVTGMPNSLWSASIVDDLLPLIRDMRVEGSPAMQSLAYTLLLAEADPPFDATPDARLLQARVDALMELGAVQPAAALMNHAGANTKPLFARWFDASLLIGQEEDACAKLILSPDLAPSYPARIFCTARAGDWDAAALTLETGRALGLITDRQDNLLTHFLDPEIAEDEALPLPPVRPDPLTFRLYEALGEPMATAPLPRRFAVSDLRDLSGWRSRLLAAERLARTGAVSENQLLGIYSERMPAASGGVWDRVEYTQRLETALKSGDPDAIGRALPPLIKVMKPVRLTVPFANLFGPDLIEKPISDEQSGLAYLFALLSNDYERAAAEFGMDHPELSFATSLAMGEPTGATTELEQTIQTGLTSTAVPATLQTLLDAGKLGQAILTTMALYQQGHAGDFPSLAHSLAAFRAVGLEDTARRAALETLLLDQL